MKILHTADWHIGKLLHKYNLAEDMDLFIDWLEELIVENSIDVILLASKPPVHDSANEILIFFFVNSFIKDFIR